MSLIRDSDPPDLVGAILIIIFLATLMLCVWP
jgi:hypothetical protein